MLHLFTPHAPIWNLLNVILTFLQSFHFYNFTSFSSEECLTFSSDLVCQSAVLSSPLSSRYSPDTISPSLLFYVLAFPVLPFQGFIPPCVTQSSFAVIDAAASFSSADINAAAGFYMCIRCCDIYSVSF